MDNFLYMMRRQPDILRGVLGHDRSRLAERNKQDQFVPIVASEQAKADKSDPFTYSRIFSHLSNGFAFPSDYSVEFAQGHSESQFLALLNHPKCMTRSAMVPVEIPMKRKVAA